MRDFIANIIRQTVEKEIARQLNREGDEKLSPEVFAQRIARQVQSQLPDFKQETKREFDDPHDSFSTEVYSRFVTPWEEKWAWDRRSHEQAEVK